MIALITMILFVTEAIPLPAVALLIPVLQVLFGIDSPTEVAHSFMNDSVFFILGSFMLAVAIVKQKIDRRLAVVLFRFTGPKVNRIVFGLIAFSACLASLIGEHTVAAIMMPVVLSLIRYSSDEQRGLAAAGRAPAFLRRILLRDCGHRDTQRGRAQRGDDRILVAPFRRACQLLRVDQVRLPDGDPAGADPGDSSS